MNYKLNWARQIWYYWYLKNYKKILLRKILPQPRWIWIFRHKRW